MRSAVAATGLTAAGLVALLGYKSGSPAAPAAAPAATPGATPAGTPSAAPTTVPAGGAAASPTAPSATASATGEDVSYRYGDIAVAVTVQGDKVTGVTTPTDDSPDFRSQSINSQAVPILTSEVLAANGASIDAVSGATYTSEAFIQSLQSALTKAGR